MTQAPPKIHPLPETVIHKIAAGEVVERPVSVVKELVENALDAGAGQIQIKVEQGGMQSIEVCDDGHGIPPQQLGMALKRHATSKITQAEDLFSLHTLGFRGEALPSIASVSDFTLESATAESEPIGYSIQVHGGQISPLQECARNRGTRVVVEDLFCTTPARKKFLKRPETEWGHISDLITALALSRLDVAWKLQHGEKMILDAPATGDPKHRILDLFGKESVKQLFPLERRVGPLGLWGLIGHPNFSRRSNRHLYVFVNGRYVQDRLINHGIVQGYRSLLMTGQYPMVVLHLNLPSELVDVNVHPAKREIKFSNGNAIHQLLSESIAQALAAAPWKQEGGTSDEGSSTTSAFHRPALALNTVFPAQSPSIPQVNIQGAVQHYLDRQEAAPQASPAPEAKMGTVGFSSLRVLGQFNLTYLVCEQEGALILIDQHAAHERIGFERLKASFQEQGMPSQALLTPLMLEFPPQESEKLLPLLPELENFGIQLDHFGGNSFALKSHPLYLKKCDWKPLLLELIETSESLDRNQKLTSRLDHVLATMACHRQIRAGDRLSQEEMQELLQQLDGTPRSYHCPHGRPVMVEISSYEIEKWFKRIV